MSKDKARFILKASALALLGLMLMVVGWAMNNRTFLSLVAIPSGIIVMIIGAVVLRISRQDYTQGAFISPGWIKNPVMRKEAYLVLGQAFLFFFSWLVPFVLWKITGQILLALMGLLAELVIMFICGIIMIRIRYVREKRS